MSVFRMSTVSQERKTQCNQEKNSMSKQDDSSSEELQATGPLLGDNHDHDLPRPLDLRQNSDWTGHHSTSPILSTVFKNSGSSRMLGFNLPQERKREVHEYLEECALRAKVKLMVSHMKEMVMVEEEEEEEAESAPVPEYNVILRKYADINPPPIAQSWLDNILKILTHKIVQKHNAMVKLLVGEIKQEYQTNLLRLSVYMKFTPVIEEQKILFLSPLKLDVGGKTPNYSSFLACRKIIENELFITHPLIRKILSSSKLAIPEVLVNLKNYRKRGWLHLDKLISLIQSDMKKGEHQICKNWYPKLINMISVKNSLEKIPSQLWPRFVKCASTVVSVQITQLMHRTISHIVETLSDLNLFPQLSLDAYYSGSTIAMVPTEDEIFTTFHRIIDTISYTAQDMPAMEAWFAVPCPNKFISVRRSESFLRSSHETLEMNLYHLFTPVRQYLKVLSEEFYGLCSEKQQFDIQMFIKEHHTFEEMFEKVSNIKMYSRKVKQMVYKEYFPVGRLSLNDVIIHLNKVSNGFISQILQEIAIQQVNENKKICGEFEMVAERTLHMPVKTKELVEMGSYIKYCRSTFMEKAKTRILKSIRLAIQLMDFTSLSEEQLYLNASIVKWLNRIKPIFEEYNDLFENTKYELEERLQRSTEKLNKELEDVGPSLSSLSNMDDVTKIADYVQFIQKFLRYLEQFDSTVSWINNEELLFKFPISTYPELDELKSIVHPFAKLIFTCNKWFCTYKIWMDGAFDELVLETVEEQVSFFFQDLTANQKSYKTKCKQQATDNYPRRFKGVVDDPDINNWPAPLKLCSQTLNHINDFKRHLRLIGIVCNSALRNRHWKDLSGIAGFMVTPDAGTTLRKFIEYHLEHLLDPFEVVSVGACKELQLFQTVCHMKAEWSDIYFTSTPYQDTQVEILCDVDEILTLVDNHLVKCVSVRGSAFVKPLISEVKAWCDQLERVNLTIETWLKVEKQWLDFHPIFVSDAVRGHLLNEVLLFQEVDGMYQELMSNVSEKMLVIKTAGETPLLNFLLEMLNILEKINAGVKVYFSKLQFYFPRLFFISNFEITKMLAETKSTEGICWGLNKIFMGIEELRYESDNGQIMAMESADGEEINFEQPVQSNQFIGHMEKLLAEVEKQMRASIKVQCKKCLNMYKKEVFKDWVVGWPSQSVQCALLTIRTGQIHNCLSQGNVDQLHFVFSTIQNQKETLFSLVQGNLPQRLRVAIEALIILTTHAVDFLQLLLSNHVICDTDFHWLVQLRYYQEDTIQVHVLNSSVPYAYEYLGNTSRLVVTPLTERCFRTLIGAYHMNLHGALEGPAGTGKTETVKDLAKALAVYCFSFCCTAGLGHSAIGKFLKGIAGCGAWGCLNDFHKVELNVMSVVAQQLTVITTAIQDQSPTFTFDGDLASLNPHCYFCVTLFPGFSVQSQVPENLKMLFRPVSMMCPDMLVVAEVTLLASGFEDYRQLALKLLTLQTLCSKLLSDQGRYACDFGCLKAVLRVASRVKQTQEHSSESGTLLLAITDILYPMLTHKNRLTLNSILTNLFPDHQLAHSPSHDQLRSYAIQVCEELRLQCGEIFLSKIIQIHEALRMYIGIILVGNPFVGKSSCLKVLRKIHKINEEENIEDIGPINPKTLSLSQLYGFVDLESKEWVDGIIPKFFRECKRKQWLVFDGPMDTSWLDVLNTALDSTRRLCLSSGEIIPISPDISVFFETMHLDEASPATVCRCGLVYTPPHSVGWQGLVLSWLDPSLEFHSAYSTNYHSLFDWIIPPTLEFVETKCNIVMKAGRYNMVRTMLLLIEMMLRDACTDNEDYGKHLPVWIQSATLLAGVWGFGGSLTPDSREQFDVFFRDIWRGNNENHPIPEVIEKLEINIPSEGQLNDYWYHFKGKGAWRFWPEVVRSLKIEEDVPNLQFTMVSTIESAKYLNILEMHVKTQSAVLLVGPTATAKTLYINKIKNRLPLDKYLPMAIPFSANTSAHFFQDFVLTKLQRKSKKVYRAPGGRIAVLFVDDMNMPPQDCTGIQAPLEVLRQYLDHSQWFRTSNNSMVKVEEMLVLCACGLPGGHRRHISSRVLRHFSLFAVSPLIDESITKVYSTILFTGFKRNGFATDVMPTVMCIVSATADVLQWLAQTLLPTPNKPHYAFSLRDFAKLIHSHLLVKRENVDSKRVFIRLWVHECLRVFGDRLIEPEDRAKLINRLRFTVKELFKESFDGCLDNLIPKGQEEVEEENLRNLVFTTALSSDSGGTAAEDRRYEEVGSLDLLLKALTAIIETHNNTQSTQIDIVLFRFALEHLCRLCRVLSISGGSCLLLGMRGSGRQTIAQLAAMLCKAHFSHPSVVHNYGFLEWREDLKRVLIQAGGNNIKSIYFASENDLKNDMFLQDIDMILSTGHVPDMFTPSELESIFEMVRLAAQEGNRNLDIDPLTVLAYFVARCRQNLHIVLSLSSISYSFRRWLSLYPSLLNYCTIDWVEPYKPMTFNGKEYKLKDWPEEALEKIAYHNWDGLEIEESILDSAVSLCKYIHVTAREATEKFFTKTGRKCYVTSASYLTMVKKFRYIIEQKQIEIKDTKAKFICGLEKLEFAAVQVSVMQKELEALQPQLQVAANETERMMKVIERETVTIDKASGLVREDEKVAKVQAAAANNLKTECEADLALAIPILEEAVAALNTLKPTDITLVKSMKNPPDTVKLVMAAVCVMKDIKPEKIPDPNTPGRKILDYWGPSKRLLGDMAFLQQLKDYDKDNIPPAIMGMIRKQYLPNKDFKPHIVAKASSAAEGLCKWVIAMDMYDAVAKEVAPKKVKLEIAEKEFAATMAILEEKRAQVRMLEEKLMDLNTKLDTAQQRKKVLEDEVGLCESKLWKAQRLIGGLGEEKERWMETVDGLQHSYQNLTGDILLSCGVIAYLAPLTSPFRESLIKDWCDVCRNLKIPILDNFKFTNVLGLDVILQHWNINELPRDEFSIENAVILEYADRCPLLVDPQGHANRWIKAKEKCNNLRVVRPSDKDYMKTVESTLNAGNPVLLENIEEDLKAVILSAFFVKQNNGVGAGGRMRPSVYITTRLQNPVFTPTVFNNFSVINFTLTVIGLQDRLLDIVIAKESPDLQRRKQMTIISNSENKIKLQQIETRILETLTYTKGNILENETAIDILDTAKTLSVEIKEKQKEAQIVEEEIYLYCKQYFSVVGHSARLYFCMTNLVNISYMYQFSLDWFIKTYSVSIDTANKSQVMETRLQCLEQRITYNLYKNICCSLFEKHRIIFSLLLCTTIQLANKEIQEDELNYFLNGCKEDPTTDNPVTWLSDAAWRLISGLDKLPSFAGFTSSFSSNNLKWKSAQQANVLEFPAPWNSSLNNFQKLIVIKIIYPDQVINFIGQYIADSMGPQYTRPPSCDISSLYEDSNCLTPLLLVVSPGSDPLAGLEQFAKKKQFSKRFHTISLGLDQEKKAKALVEQCREDGNWVCLQNCHLAHSYMPALERMCDSLTLHNTNMEFRLWLTCSPTTQFPMSLLQGSVKMTTDLQSGLKQRLLHSFVTEPVSDKDFFYSCPGKDRAFAKLLYSLSFLNAVVQERLKFGNAGWNVPYEFTEVDFHISLHQLQMYINKCTDIPCNIVQYVVGECNYGGRLQDERDRRLLNNLVGDLINIQVVETPNYPLSSISYQYHIPLRFEYHDFIASIQELPDNPTAEVFGLNYNAEIQHNIDVAQELFDTLMLLQPNAMKKKHWHKAPTLSAVNSILKKLPSKVSLKEESTSKDPKAKIKDTKIDEDLIIKVANQEMDITDIETDEADLESSTSKLIALSPKVEDMDILIKATCYESEFSIPSEDHEENIAGPDEGLAIVLSQECNMYNRLLSIIHDSLEAFKGAFLGNSEISEDIEQLGFQVERDEIPYSWLKVSYTTSKTLGGYIDDLINRINFLKEWCCKGFQQEVWLPGLFCPQALLVTVLHRYSVSIHTPFHLLDYDHVVLDALDSLESSGLVVWGLHLQGAHWNHSLSSLQEQIPGVFFSEMPRIWFKPSLKSDIVEGNRYCCPLYTTTSRRDHVTQVMLPTKTPCHWIYRGVVLLCQLDV